MVLQWDALKISLQVGNRSQDRLDGLWPLSPPQTQVRPGGSHHTFLALPFECACDRTATRTTSVWQYPMPVDSQRHDMFVAEVETSFIWTIYAPTNSRKSCDAWKRQAQPSRSVATLRFVPGRDVTCGPHDQSDMRDAGGEADPGYGFTRPSYACSQRLCGAHT